MRDKRYATRILSTTRERVMAPLLSSPLCASSAFSSLSRDVTRPNKGLFRRVLACYLALSRRPHTRLLSESRSPRLLQECPPIVWPAPATFVSASNLRPPPPPPGACPAPARSRCGGIGRRRRTTTRHAHERRAHGHRTTRRPPPRHPPTPPPDRPEVRPTRCRPTRCRPTHARLSPTPCTRQRRGGRRRTW